MAGDEPFQRLSQTYLTSGVEDHLEDLEQVTGHRIGIKGALLGAKIVLKSMRGRGKGAVRPSVEGVGIKLMFSTRLKT